MSLLSISAIDRLTNSTLTIEQFRCLLQSFLFPCSYWRMERIRGFHSYTLYKSTFLYFHLHSSELSYTTGQLCMCFYSRTSMTIHEFVNGKRAAGPCRLL